MANGETLRSVSITIAQEKIQIRTDLPDAELQQIVDFIGTRLDNSSKFRLDSKKQLSLLAVELTSEIFELRKQLHMAKIYHDQMEKVVRDLSLVIDEATNPTRSQI